MTTEIETETEAARSSSKTEKFAQWLMTRRETSGQRIQPRRIGPVECDGVLSHSRSRRWF